MFIRATVASALLAFADAQGMGDGLAKSTYASSDPLPGLEFMLKYLPVTVAIDSCPSNAKTQGRAQLVEPGFIYDRNCHMYSSVGDAAPSTSAKEPTALTYAGTPGDDCAYTTGSAFDDSETAGGLNVSEVEAVFAAKVANFSSGAYDAFFDFNVVLYAADLDAYGDAFAKDGVPTLRFSWTSAEGETWHSLLVHVPKSQMILELVSQNSKTTPTLAMETRMSNRTAVRMSTTSVLGAVEVLDVKAAGVARKCYQWGWAGSDVCFVQRDDDAKFTVADLEATPGVARGGTSPSVHDKWGDNHYAMDLPGTSGASIVKAFTANYAQIYPIANKSTTYAFSCEQHYIIDPTGFSIQTDLDFMSGW
ncbi:hypothetical protein JL721_8820 [Aureococcus anophagefferens]|nr:hypothetical protein JL721_8820 [Aureococcus anophagefferens]